MTRIGAFIQARMSSSRLSGKVLGPLAGKPVLAYLLERLERVRELDFVVVATSSESSDEPIRDFCVRRGTACHAGSLADVARRFAEAARAHPCQGMLRCCADSPLLDLALVRRGLDLFREIGADVVTNVHPRSFPVGQSVEVVCTAAFLDACEGMQGEEREHCTLHFYNNPDRIRIINFDSGGHWEHRSLAVDTADDRRRLERLAAAMDRPHWTYGWRELLDMEDALGEPGSAHGSASCA